MHKPLGNYWFCLCGIVSRELLRFSQQKARFLASIIRPILWLFVFSAGLHGAVVIINCAPYKAFSDESQIPYGVYILPGLIGMIQLFNGMQSSLSMVYDRELGSLRLLLISPLPRAYLLFCKLLAGCCLSLFQIAVFLCIAALSGYRLATSGYILVIPALMISGLLFGAMGLFLSARIKQLENFSGIMNFVIFPLFFLSSALYPIDNFKNSSYILYYSAFLNPFNQAIEMIRFAAYGQLHLFASSYTICLLLVFWFAARHAYRPEYGLKRIIR